MEVNYPGIIETTEAIIGWFRNVTDIIRNLLLKLLSILPFEEKISLYLVFFGVSLYLAYLYNKGFTMTPFSARYIPKLLILTILIFLLLMYL